MEMLGMQEDGGKQCESDLKEVRSVLFWDMAKKKQNNYI